MSVENDIEKSLFQIYFIYCKQNNESRYAVLFSYDIKRKKLK